MTRENLNSISLFILFLLNPIISLCFSFFIGKYRDIRNITILFSVYLGISFEVTKNSTADSLFYFEQLDNYFNYGFDLNAFFLSLYINGDFLDLYQPLITFIVSLFTNNYKVLFAFFGLFFGFFYAKNLSFLIEYNNSIKSGLKFIFIALIAFSIPIYDGINGVRFYTAAQVFIFALYSYFLKDKRPYFFLIIPIFIHWTFVIPLVLFIIFKFIKNFDKLFYFLLLISLLNSIINPEFILNVIERIIPFEGIVTKSSLYLNEDYVDEVNSIEVSSFLSISHFGIRYFIFVFVFLLFIKHKCIWKSIKEYHLFKFGLLFYSFVLLLSSVPSVGRFETIAQIILMTTFLNVLKNQNVGLIFKLGYTFTPIFILFIITKVRFLFNYVDFYFFYGNPIINFFINTGITLNERYF